MKRLAQLLACPPYCVPLVVLRWVLLLITTGLVLAPIGADATTWQAAGAALAALCFAWVFLLGWTRYIRALIVPSPYRTRLLTLDVVLSTATMIVAGTMGDRLAPFALGALIFPSAVYGWVGAGTSVVGFVSLVAFWQYAYGHAPLPPTVLDYALTGAIIALMSPLSVTIYGRRRRKARKPTALALRPPAPLVPPPPQAPRPTAFTPLLPGPAPTQRASERLPSATLERRAMRLHAAVRQVVREAQHGGLRVQLQIDGREPDVPPSYAPLIAKATEIALDNVRQHAHTAAADVHLRHSPAVLTLTVRDHGSGLLDGTAELPGFRQLKLLRYRLHEWGGTLEITEPDDDGVLFVLTLPFPA